ncbi:MAG TPA: DUF488 domain-containing protein [Anaerohalosphaeraceae bacterium]|nr:DUF488 domain-containing protein [Anaerohalosphaeraceae bacterium]HRT50013.1 DUF488 domain-containing protein [Anaerohalosphaeraceae bacterium]HRT85816.1 DUF488 domain-containing protein [Anaerohalosphaeraceae bacterium]
MPVQVKRVYDRASRNDGYRVLVDRVWPRGIRKEEAELDEWLKDIAPSTDLRKWFGHDPDKWKEFRNRYFEELSDKKSQVQKLRSLAKERRITLLYGARDGEHNNAVALKDYIERGGRGRK